ncbi:hypothetical protein F4827_005047 [Paraburkholderia bannensis]|uniref:Uncharacterized protein n=1 Tax=Paraburkholderia bannensis TaxID=765414 RepID=A0A7W9U171_9BURK|nr:MULTISPECIES: hypothetical protein [Paraburkholderia]MBB3259975.1 hypothetical protein [Paraburkholderia sp. WP4_3_2]MBB6105181.1 hypothetical protein [Paraburkholderia bannensis]
MEKGHLPRHLLRAEWQLLRMTGDFDAAIRKPEVVRTLESSARARELRDQRRVAARADSKLRAAGDYDD